MTREAIKNRPDLWPQPMLRVVDENGEVHGRCVACENKREAIDGLKNEVARLVMEKGKLQRQLHRDLEVEPEAESVKRVYAEWRRLCATGAHKRIAPGRLQMGLDRRKTFSEEEMLLAVRHAAAERPDRRGRTWKKWENIMRNDGNLLAHLDEGSASPDLVVQDAALAEVCDCGHPRIDHAKPHLSPVGAEPCGHRSCGCSTFDTLQQRADAFLERQRGRAA